MTDQLSPAAQTVWLAAWHHSPVNCESHEDRRRQQIAAALRAAANQVVPLRDAPKIAFDAKRPTIEWHVWNAKQRARADILAIAAELEAL